MGFQTVEICVGHIPLYAREANGRVLPAQHTMALALGTMVANDRTGQAHGIVLEEKRTGLLDSLILEQLDNV
jgi:hypothetical protein